MISDNTQAPQLPQDAVRVSVLKNREIFLKELRSGKYTKGCIKSDNKGNPIIEKESDNAENTACCCAIMAHLFGKQPNGKLSLPKAMKALELKATDCKFIQTEINDRDSTLSEDAEVIEALFFDNEKFNLVQEKVNKYLSNIGNGKHKKEKATPLERIYIKKIIYDFKVSGKTIHI